MGTMSTLFSILKCLMIRVIYMYFLYILLNSMTIFEKIFIIYIEIYISVSEYIEKNILKTLKKIIPKLLNKFLLNIISAKKNKSLLYIL